MKEKKKISYMEKKMSRQYFLMVLPGFVIFTIGLIVPLFLAVRYSFTSWDGMSAEKPFVAFQNYIDLLKDPEFRNAWWFTLRFTIWNTIIQNVVALLFAVALDSGIKAQKVYRTVLRGLLIANNWQWIGYWMLIYLAGLQSVPGDLHEAARIDGCSVFRTYFSVVLPLLKPAMATLIIMQSFQIWNDYLLASLYVSKKQLKTLTVAIQSLFSAQSSDYTTAMAAIVISVLPIAVLFLSLQKYFIKGMTVGAVKG